MDNRNKKRLQLILIASIFVAPMLVAAVLALGGWTPGARSYGEGIVPQRTFEDVAVELADGSRLAWHDPDWRWTLLALPGPACAEACIAQLDRMHRARISLNQNAARVRLLYVGEPPQPGAGTLSEAWQVGRDVENRLAEWRPDAGDGVAAVLVKPDGTALTVYRTGFDANGMRKDLAKVTK